MSQFLRPDADITTTNIASGSYADIDEATADNADYIQTATLSVGNGAVYECSLSNPTGSIGTAIVRYRVVIPGGIGVVNSVISLVQGTTVRDSDSQAVPLIAVTKEWTPDTSGVTDWDNVRLRWNLESLSGSSSVRILWAEVEAFPLYEETISESAAASDGYASTATLAATLSESAEAEGTFAGGFFLSETLGETASADGSFAGGVDYYASFTETASATDSYTATVLEPGGWTIPAAPRNGWVEGGSAGGAWTEISDTDTDWTER